MVELFRHIYRAVRGDRDTDRAVKLSLTAPQRAPGVQEFTGCREALDPVSLRFSHIDNCAARRRRHAEGVVELPHRRLRADGEEELVRQRIDYRRVRSGRLSCADVTVHHAQHDQE